MNNPMSQYIASREITKPGLGVWSVGYGQWAMAMFRLFDHWDDATILKSQTSRFIRCVCFGVVYGSCLCAVPVH